MEKDIRLAIIGAGNCASNLIQGLYYYKNIDDTSERVSGLMHNSLGGYLVRHVKPVVAFDVHAGKVGKDLSEALQNTYAAIGRISFEGAHYRTDIGWRDVSRKLTHD